MIQSREKYCPIFSLNDVSLFMKLVSLVNNVTKKLKVNLILYIPGRHMREFMFNLSTRGKWMVSFTAWLLYHY